MAIGKRIYWIVGLVAVLALVGAAVTFTSALTSAGGEDNDAPITGQALQRASDAALAHTGGGRVTETEVGDEESLYEVEVTLGDGSQVDVQLDENFNVVGESADEEDGPGDQDGPGDD
jgi:hypothetical protein